MMNSTASMSVYEGEDGILLIGSPDLLSSFDNEFQLSGSPLSPKTMSRLGNALGGVAELQGQSGRWLKLDSESARFLKDRGIKDVAAGVVRRKDFTELGNGGQIAKYLRFEAAGLLTPAAPAALAAMASQAAVEAALEEIQEYLEKINEKLDQLLKQKKVETLGQLGGVTLTIHEAEVVQEKTGTVSAVTWSKVQTISLELKSRQAEALSQLKAIAEDFEKQTGNVGKIAGTLSQAQEDVSFWLGVLARTLELEERFYLLEFAHVADHIPEQLEAHRQGIRIARTERGKLIANSLRAITSLTNVAAEMSNFSRFSSPFDAKRVVRRVNDINQTIGEFARHVDLETSEIGLLDYTLWRHAAKGVIDDAASFLGSAGSEAVGRVKQASDHLQDRREKALLLKAEEILEKHRAREADASVETDGTASTGD